MHHWDLSYEAAVLRYIKTRFRLEVPAIDRHNHITSHVTTGTDIRCVKALGEERRGLFERKNVSAPNGTLHQTNENVLHNKEGSFRS